MGPLTNEIQLKPARYAHLPVLSECDADCTLCATLGCLRPMRITSPELRRDLDLARAAMKTTVVFPPNFLHHPEAAQFISDVVARDLAVIVRLRPEQLILFSELIATLQYRGASFEVVVSRPLPARVLGRGLAMAGGGVPFARSFPAFKTLFVPTREFDAGLLFESLPFAWRRDAEVLVPMPGVQAGALSADELFVFTRRVTGLRRYVELDRIPVGLVPRNGLGSTPVRFSYRAPGATENAVRFSAVAVLGSESRTDEWLAAVSAQSMPSSDHEIIFALDRVSDESVESLSAWAKASGRNISAIALGRCWGEPSLRVSQGWNLAATYARGSSIAFLNFATPAKDLGPDVFSTIARSLETRRLSLWPKFVGGLRSTDSLACGMTLRHYFDIGGFAEALQHSGFEIEFARWKSVRAGVPPFEIPMGGSVSVSASAQAVSPKMHFDRKLALSAQEFFVCTLDPEVFETHFELMGARPRVRRLMKAVADLGIVQGLQSIIHRLAVLIDRQRFALSIRRKALS